MERFLEKKHTLYFGCKQLFIHLSQHLVFMLFGWPCNCENGTWVSLVTGSYANQIMDKVQGLLGIACIIHELQIYFSII